MRATPLLQLAGRFSTSILFAYLIVPIRNAEVSDLDRIVWGFGAAVRYSAVPFGDNLGMVEQRNQ